MKTNAVYHVGWSLTARQVPATLTVANRKWTIHNNSWGDIVNICLSFIAITHWWHLHMFIYLHITLNVTQHFYDFVESGSVLRIIGPALCDEVHHGGTVFLGMIVSNGRCQVGLVHHWPEIYAIYRCLNLLNDVCDKMYFWYFIHNYVNDMYINDNMSCWTIRWQCTYVGKKKGYLHPRHMLLLQKFYTASDSGHVTNDRTKATVMCHGWYTVKPQGHPSFLTSAIP